MRFFFNYSGIHRISSEYLNKATSLIKDKNRPNQEKGILERILETNEAFAKPVVNDILSAGIDTVSI